jgi:hypothetical protein
MVYDRMTASVVRWSEFLDTDSEVWVRFGTLPHFLRSSGSETGSLNLVSTVEELLGRKSSGSNLEIREYSCRDPSRSSRGTLYPQKLALTPPSGGHSISIVCSFTQAMECVCVCVCLD